MGENSEPGHPREPPDDQRAEYKFWMADPRGHLARLEYPAPTKKVVQPAQCVKQPRGHQKLVEIPRGRLEEE